ncbi:SDR family NAD(P)-dependent oxidoreductase [Achromobacter aloeverae]|uniref:3-oxoacyl-ACP reductase n=1 Tax=Achromobacter aloeverae TaxID=1750518 RepID=A0A4Q1HGF3_9BURK|nr:SDR family oxidoreductase [Achromobacter aloeverae]RXN85254.1 3-oxoacyl-ACP reductase [Achromobacter aloeverae]
MKYRLQDKIAVVMGGGASAPEAGISNGQAVALTYAREGARVVVADLHLAAAEATVEMIRAEGGVADAVQADVSRHDDTRRVMAHAVQRWDRLDILHNNVGIEYLGGPVDTPEEAWDRVHEVNLKSVFLACKEAIPLMERHGGGSIINVSSTASLRYAGVPYLAYNSSKAALNHVSRIIARQYAPQQIRCNVVVPGYMDTPHIRTLYRHLPPERFAEVMRERDAKCPMGRQGSCWDVARAALFLASDDATYVTGTLLMVDGGASI